MDHKVSKKAGSDIVKAVSHISLSPVVVAQAITNAPHAVQRSFYKIVRSVIHLWAIDYDGMTYHPDNKDIHKWAKEHDND